MSIAVLPSTRVCKTCGKEKSIDKYHTHGEWGQYRRKECASCRCAYAKEYRKTRPSTNTKRLAVAQRRLDTLIATITVSDSYVKTLLRSRGLAEEDMTRGVMDAQRALIKLKRAIKQKEEGQ